MIVIGNTDGGIIKDTIFKFLPGKESDNTTIAPTTIAGKTVTPKGIGKPGKIDIPPPIGPSVQTPGKPAKPEKTKTVPPPPPPSPSPAPTVTTNNTREIINAPIRECPSGQRMDANRECIEEF